MKKFSDNKDGAPLKVERIIRASGVRWILMALFLWAFTYVYFQLGTHLVYQANLDRTRWDQQHNITLARRALSLSKQPVQQGESVTTQAWQKLPHYTDGVVNPLWPWVAGQFASEDDGIFFTRGKWFNVTITGLFAVGLGIFCLGRMSLLAAINVTLLAGLGAFLPRAPFFQPEPLFYIFFLLSWMSAMVLLRRNPPWLYAALGGCAGLAYLAKGSVEPLLLVFVGLSCLRFFAKAATRRPIDDGRDRWMLQNHFLGLACLATTFLIITGPRLVYAYEYYGKPFYSYLSYWMWMDDFEEGARFMQKFSNKEALSNMAPEEKPSAFNYIKTHTAAEMFERMAKGVLQKVQRGFFPTEITQNKARTKAWHEILPARGWYLIWIWLGATAMALLWRRLRPPDERIASSPRLRHGWMIVFLAVTFCLYTAAFGWYTPIGKGNRFMLMLYVPMIVSLMWMGEELRSACIRVSEGKTKQRLRLCSVSFQLLLTGAILWRVAELLRTPLFDPHG